jgi:hypothetical protein
VRLATEWIGRLTGWFRSLSPETKDLMAQVALLGTGLAAAGVAVGILGGVLLALASPLGGTLLVVGTLAAAFVALGSDSDTLEGKLTDAAVNISKGFLFLQASVAATRAFLSEAFADIAANTVSLLRNILANLKVFAEDWGTVWESLWYEARGGQRADLNSMYQHLDLARRIAETAAPKTQATQAAGDAFNEVMRQAPAWEKSIREAAQQLREAATLDFQGTRPAGKPSQLESLSGTWERLQKALIGDDPTRLQREQLAVAKKGLAVLQAIGTGGVRITGIAPVIT